MSASSDAQCCCVLIVCRVVHYPVSWVCLVTHLLCRQAALAPEEELKPRTERLAVVGSSLQYKGERGLPGLYISGLPLSVDKPYFEVEITTSEGSSGGGGPVIGLCSHR